MISSCLRNEVQLEVPHKPLRNKGHSERPKIPPKEYSESKSIPDILSLKRDGKELTAAQIEKAVQAITDGSMEDGQLGAFLMSIYLNGMTTEETSALTVQMKNSGSVFTWPKEWKVVDKHSTGGVGDKISLALAPALAANGLKVPMISGRGLEHTGGTLDKLESIPGFKVSLGENEIKRCLEKVGCCIIGQTRTLVPADGRMYALRDVTSTVSSIPLIVSSIISKKASEGLHSLVMDVKFGGGSVIGSLPEAETLAQALVGVGSALGINTTALVTAMDTPIGRCIGNSLEVREALDCLNGGGPDDLRLLVTQLGGELMFSSGVCSSIENGVSLIIKSLDDGSALKKFYQMVEFQGALQGVIDKIIQHDLSFLPKSQERTLLYSQEAGRVTHIDAMAIAKIGLAIGGGRMKSTDSINHGVGIVLLKVVGDEVVEGEAWIEIHHDDPLEDSLLKKARASITISPIQGCWLQPPLIVKRISSQNDK